MLLSEMVEGLGCEEILHLDGHRSRRIDTGFAADLMSEVLAFCGHGALLITGLTSVQSVHTADVADLSAILFVNGKRPGPEVVSLAKELEMPLFTTKLTMYEVCSRLHRLGLLPSTKA
jgi:predicted transcriptional regulator